MENHTRHIARLLLGAEAGDVVERRELRATLPEGTTRANGAGQALRRWQAGDTRGSVNRTTVRFQNALRELDRLGAITRQPTTITVINPAVIREVVG